MPQTKMTKQQKIIICQAIIFVSTWIIIVFLCNLIIFHYFGIFPTEPPPHHTPSECFVRDYQFCTNYEGRCTKNKKKCVFFPQRKKECKYVVFTNQEESQQKQEDIWQQMKKRKNIRSKQWLVEMERVYCSTQSVQLYAQIIQGVNNSLFIWQILLTNIISLLLWPEVNKVACYFHNF